MNKRVLSVLLSLMMIVGLLPMSAIAVSYPSADNVDICGTSFKNNAYYKNGDTTTFTGTAADYNAWYEEATGILHLKNFEYTGEGNDSNGVIRCTQSLPLTIDVQGTNTLKQTSNYNNAIYSRYGQLSFTGSGTLNVTVENDMTSSSDYAIQAGKDLIVGGSVTLNVNATGGGTTYGIYGQNGITIKDSAKVTVSVNAKNASHDTYCLYVYSGAIKINSTKTTALNLAGANTSGTNVGIRNDAYTESVTDNGDITINSTVTITNTNARQSRAIESMARNGNVDGVITLDGANVTIKDCDLSILNGSKTRGSAEPDIVIRNSTLNTDCDMERGNGTYGIASYYNGILIQDSNVSISCASEGFITYFIGCSNDNDYGVDIKGSSVVTVTGAADRNLIYGSTAEVWDFDLTSGGSITVQQEGLSGMEMMRDAYIKLGPTTMTNGTKESQHSTDSDAWTYFKSGAPLTFTYGVPTYGISLDKSGTHIFPAANVGYADQTPATVTVTNTGTGATGALTVALTGDDSAFTLSKTSIDSIAVGGTDTFTVQPKTGLSAGAYTAIVTVSGGSVESQNFIVKFQVNEATDHTITFNPGSGSGTMANVVVADGDTYTLPACTFTAPDGKVFDCWNVGGNRKAVGATITVTEDITVFAVWMAIEDATELSATVTLPVAGANPVSSGTPGDASKYSVTSVSFLSGAYTLIASDTFEAGKTYTILVNFTPKSGYTIPATAAVTINGVNAVYWAPIADGLGTKKFAIEYTVPSISTDHTITFNPGSGSGTMADVVVADGATYTLPACTFTAPDGMVFDEWAVNGNRKAVGATITVTDDITVIALWKVSHTHSGVLVPGVAATCTEAGSKAYYTCSCGKNFEDMTCTIEIADVNTWKVLDALGHDLVDDAAVAATCTTAGKEAGHHCTRCDYTDGGAVIPASGHSYSVEWSNDATNHWHACSVCGDKKDVTAHTWNYDSATEEHDKHCTVCGYVAEAQLSHTHAGTLVVGRAATCTEAGSKAYYTCSCGKNFEDMTCTVEIADVNTWKVIPALGHNSDGSVAHKDATCTEAGVVGGTYCTRCDDGKAAAEATISALGHNSDGNVAHKDATCTEAGVVGGTYCTRCNDGKAAAEAVIPALGHNSDGSVAHKDATCTEAGVVGGTYCTRCNDGKAAAEATISALGHNSDGSVAHKDATCTEAGVVGGTYCTRCNDGKSAAEAVIPALGHNSDGNVAHKEATCTEDGVLGGTYCTRCNDGKTVAETVIPALGHDLVSVSAVAATCTEAGKEAGHYCTRCDYTDGGAVIAALGHRYSAEWSNDATNHWHECSTCGDKQDEAAHTWNAETATEENDKHYHKLKGGCYGKTK